MRVPMIAYWQGKIQPAVIDQPAVGVDVVPTILDYLGIVAPTDRQLDGSSLRGLFENPAAAAPRTVHYFRGGDLLALRHGDLKYQTRKHVNYAVDSALTVPVSKGPWLFNLKNDEQESYNLLSGAYRDTEHMEQRFMEAQARFAENPRGWVQPSTNNR